MATEAEAITEARADIERISRAALDAIDQRYEGEALWREPYGAFPECSQREAEGLMRGVITDLLHEGLIRVGRRPQTGPAPMRGQTTIQEAENAAEVRQ